MPAPVECQANVNILSYELGDVSQVKATVVLDCGNCSIGEMDFSSPADAEQPQKAAIEKARNFLTNACGQKMGREHVILPRGL